MIKQLEIRIRGTVQGVGFRPFIYRIALKHKIRGYVLNDTEGVLIRAQGEEAALKHFMDDINTQTPPLAFIANISTRELEPEGFTGFVIQKSVITSERSAFIPPDSAVCDECVKEFFDQSDRRYLYPFITCTNCGPRYSIISDIPYDRKNTSMSVFPMCDDCSREYGEPLDRRFHTQPDACAICGPRLFLYDKNRRLISDNSKEIAEKTAGFLRDGKIVAIKGVGGYLLACDAKNDCAVSELRLRKGRPFKPFALMAGDMSKIEEFLHVSSVERRMLESRERPIVLLKEKTQAVSRYVAPGLTYIGIMLPYTPFQHLLFSVDKEMALVMTSGNISEEPIIFKDDDAFEGLGCIADYFVTYNREILAFSDDSVLFVLNGEPNFIRRSRGYVPVPFASSNTRHEILATGGDLKNSFALARGNIIILTQFLGDLASPTGNDLYRKTIEHFKRIYHFVPDVVAADMHPGYFTSEFADELEASGLKLVKTQHHHAHIASVMEDRGVDEKLIGIAYDGTGYGTDGKLWGSEFLIADKKEFIRAAHFSYFPLPGGESAIKDVWKIGAALLYQRYGKDIPVMERREETEMLFEIIRKGINSPETCSIGRIFDGVSGMLGISRSVSTEAEAAQLLEEAAFRGRGKGRGDGFIIPFNRGTEIVISTQELSSYIAEMVSAGKGIEEIAYLFHLSIAGTTVEIAKHLRNLYDINRVALSGGSFQNRLLLELVLAGLKEKKFDIYTPLKIPSNDGCLAVGQAAIAKELLKDNE